MEFNQEKAMKLEAILKNNEFIQRTANITTVEELQVLISEYGLEMPVEEVVEFCGLVAKEKERIDNGGEISPEELEDVSGGGALFVLGCIGLGVVALGGLAIGSYNGYKGNS